MKKSNKYRKTLPSSVTVLSTVEDSMDKYFEKNVGYMISILPYSKLSLILCDEK